MNEWMHSYWYKRWFSNNYRTWSVNASMMHNMWNCGFEFFLVLQRSSSRQCWRVCWARTRMLWFLLSRICQNMSCLPKVFFKENYSLFLSWMTFIRSLLDQIEWLSFSPYYSGLFLFNLIIFLIHLPLKLASDILVFRLQLLISYSIGKETSRSYLNEDWSMRKLRYCIALKSIIC